MQLHTHHGSGILPFYEAVDVSQLLQLLAHDKEDAVRVKVTELLLSSYIPSEEEGSAFVMALLQQHPRAARAFCQVRQRSFYSHQNTSLALIHSLYRSEKRPEDCQKKPPNDGKMGE